jgi:hypothetical protein
VHAIANTKFASINGVNAPVHAKRVLCARKFAGRARSRRVYSPSRSVSQIITFFGVDLDFNEK